jgi:peptide/nickel transport system permease protein
MTTSEPDAAFPSRAPLRLQRRRRGLGVFIKRSPMTVFWGCITAAILLMAVAAPVVAPYEPLKSDFRAMSKPPDAKHYFGTDQIGRDTLSRVIYGSRASLTVAFGAVLFGTTLGALWGLASGYFGGRFDILSQRMIEFLQSFPDLILAMAIAMALGAGIGTVIVAIAITRIPFGGRVIRAVVLSLKEMSYVEAARGLGASHLRMMLRHILPQCIAPYLILATTHLGVAIIIEAALGFLGVGIPPPTPTWGNMLSDALNAGLVPPWWLVLFPGAAITLTVLAFNLLGDGIRDILDPVSEARYDDHLGRRQTPDASLRAGRKSTGPRKIDRPIVKNPRQIISLGSRRTAPSGNALREAGRASEGASRERRAWHDAPPFCDIAL